MGQVIEFYYDFGSPNAYLVEAVLPAIAAKHGAKLQRHPILLGGLFKAVGNTPPMVGFRDVPGKLDYMRLEMNRFIARHKIPFQWTPYFPILSTSLMRGAIYAQNQPWDTQYRKAVYRHCWVLGSNMTDTDVMASVLSHEGLPSAEIMAAVQDPAIKSALFDATAAAVDRQIFGIPTMFVGNEMFFGKDSLFELEAHLTKSDKPFA